MDKYNLLKNELLQINQDILSLFSKAGQIPGTGDQTFANWDKTCCDMRKQISEEVLRVAVVGPIKSGKSTFVNSLFQDDYLKRGAGVVTSIVTRIHRGDSLKATIWFKSWNDVNQDIKQAMILFPSTDWRTAQTPFDIRNKQDREELHHALESLNKDLLITNDTRNINSVLLTSYIKGFERVKDIVSEQGITIDYEGSKFEEHKDFVGDDTLAVYLNDIQLEINSGSIDSNIEIADCQGSDSPNPLHLAMIQDYLVLTHLIVYVISSRTGLRQADIKFLSAIKKMGIIENTLFLVNFDFSEHDSIEDLNQVIDKIKEELSLIKPEPEIYTLSGLFNLFKSKKKDQLSVKDNLRLAQWKGEISLAKFSDQETQRFEQAIHQKLTKERYALLLKNHLERLRVIGLGIKHWVGVNNDILVKDAFGVNEILEGINIHKKKADQIKSMIKSTLDGAVQKIRKSLKTDTDRCFDNKNGLPGDVLSFIKNYSIAYNDYEYNVTSSGFSNTMYLVFQEVRRAVDAFMAESINPEIIHFIRETEQKIKDHFDNIAGTYDTMIKDALNEYNYTMQNLGISSIQNNYEKTYLPDISSIKKSAGLKIPAAATAMNYSAAIKTEAFMRLGFYRFISFLKKMLKRSEDKNQGELLALKAGVSRLKGETEKSIIFHFKDYRENIKYQYILKLADAVSKSLYNALVERFEAYSMDLSKISELVSEKQIDKTQTSKNLNAIEDECNKINKAIINLKNKIEAA